MFGDEGHVCRLFGIGGVGYAGWEVGRSGVGILSDEMIDLMWRYAVSESVKVVRFGFMLFRTLAGDFSLRKTDFP